MRMGLYRTIGAVTPLLEIWVWLSFQKPQKQETSLHSQPAYPAGVYMILDAEFWVGEDAVQNSGDAGADLWRAVGFVTRYT